MGRIYNVRLMKIKKPFIKSVIQICIITGLAALLSKTILYSFTSMPAFKSMIEVKDVQMSDFYNRVSNSKPVRELSQHVVLIPIDGKSREQIAQVIKCVSQEHPKAIGVDLLFEYPYDSDSALIESVTGENVIMAAVDMGNGERTTSYFCDSTFRIGMVNMLAASSGSVVREFSPTYPEGNCFALEIIKDAYPSQYSDLLNGGDERKAIYYPSIEFPIIEADSVMVGVNMGNLQDKVVLIGDCNNMADMHVTPIGTMSGLNVHASIIETIIGERYVKSFSPFTNWIIAILSCLLFVSLNVFVSKKIPAVGKLIIRVVQLLVLYLYFAFGCWLFIHKHINIDFSLSLAMIALGLLAYDIWVGIEALCKGIYKRIKH